jgi:hypothetical protein
MDLIYVQMVDAVECWVPVEAKPIDNNLYLILENDDCYTGILEFGELFEFFPGDIVEVVDHSWSYGKNVKLATKLVTASSYPDRKLFDFLFKVWQRRIPFDKNTFNAYSEEIKRVKEEDAEGKVFNPIALMYLKELEQIANTSGD